MTVGDTVARATGDARNSESRERDDRSLVRVGGIDYLNSLPLTAYLAGAGEPRFELVNLVPSALADGLRRRELDVALVPVVEYFADDRYEIVPGMCISSYGAVDSIRLFVRSSVRECRRVLLDASSRTSVLLTQLLFRRAWTMDADPEFTTRPSDELEALLERVRSGASRANDEAVDAVLLIGDAALRQSAPPGWQQLDLGNEWTRWTGLPFVYAFWVWRGDVPAPAGLVDKLREGRRIGESRVDDIAREWRGVRGVDEHRCREYLARVIQYEFSVAQREGLEKFFALLCAENLIAGDPPSLRFVTEAV